MFCKKISVKIHGVYKKPSDEPSLINKLYKHRTLAELIAMSKETGIPPMPTRGGVYTGEQPIPRDKFDQANLIRESQAELNRLQSKLEEAQKADELKASQRKEAELRAKIEAELKASLPVEK